VAECVIVESGIVTNLWPVIFIRKVSNTSELSADSLSLSPVSGGAIKLILSLAACYRLNLESYS